MYNFKFEISSRANPYLSDIFNILHDFDLSHNLSIVLTSSEYSGYRFSHYFFRNRLKLKDEDKLRISKIITESPIQITLTIPVHSTTISMTIIKALNILLNIIKDASKPLKREKEKQEIQNLKKDTTLTKTEIEN